MKIGKPYGKEHALSILKPIDGSGRWTTDERGVWPALEFDLAKNFGLLPEYRLLSWKPVLVFKDDCPPPDCKNTPALPFPFDGRDLAAFMVEGVGAFVSDFYGDWVDGPDWEAVQEIDPGDNYARQALREAYDAYREAAKQMEKRGLVQASLDALVAELLNPRTDPSESETRPAPQAVPVGQTEAIAANETPMSRRGLVMANKHQWPRIEADLQDAAKNGLSLAKAGSRGWIESKALQWARAKGHLTNGQIAPLPPSKVDPMAAHYGQLEKLPRQTHKL